MMKLQYIKDAKERLISGRIMNEMSKGRKIFRFLKFVDELHSIFELQRGKKPFLLKFLSICDKLSSLIYYLLDNVIWGMDTGIFGSN